MMNFFKIQHQNLHFMRKVRMLLHTLVEAKIPVRHCVFITILLENGVRYITISLLKLLGALSLNLLVWNQRLFWLDAYSINLGSIMMFYIVKKRDSYTDPLEKQPINPWKLKLLSCLTLGVVSHSLYCIWILATSDFYYFNNPPALRIMVWFKIRSLIAYIILSSSDYAHVV